MSDQGCTARLGTYRHTDEVLVGPVPELLVVQRRGHRMYRVDTWDIECSDEWGSCGEPMDEDGTPVPHHDGNGLQWNDDTPGAVPHVDPPPPLVTDAEYRAAEDVWQDESVEDDGSVLIRRMLEAAAKVRREAGDA